MKGGEKANTIGNSVDIQFMPWSSSFSITSEGAHVVDFEKDFPLTFGCFRFSFDRQLTPNYHDYFEISYVYNGNGTFRIGNRDYRVKRGDIVVLGNTEIHTLLTDSHDSIDVISIFFLPELVYKPGKSDLDFEYVRIFYNYDFTHSNYIPCESVNSDVIFGFIERAYKAYVQKESHYKLKIKNCLCEILLQLLLYYEGALLPETSHYDKRLSDIRRLNPVFLFIEKNYQEKITLEQAAEKANMSPQYFCRYFKKVTGSTFTQYLQQVRIDKAKQIMLTKNMSVTQVAFEVGFESLSHFFRVFRRMTLLSPTDFLKKIEN